MRRIYPARSTTPLKQAVILQANFFFSFITDHRQLPSSSEPIISGTHGTSLLARAHESLNGRPLHDSPLSSKDIRLRSLRRRRTAPRPVAHARAPPHAHPLLHISYHPSAHSLTVSPRLVVSIPARIPSYPSIPSASTLLYRSTPSRVASVDVLSKHTKTKT